MDFISSEALENTSSIEKIYKIIDRVKDGNLVVMEGNLTTQEQTELIETTMREFDVETFAGIDINTLDKTSTSILRRTKKTTVVTIIGPADKVKMLQKEPNFISVVANSDGK